jgi:hypothetical protein
MLLVIPPARKAWQEPDMIFDPRAPDDAGEDRKRKARANDARASFVFGK